MYLPVDALKAYSLSLSVAAREIAGAFIAAAEYCVYFLGLFPKNKNPFWATLSVYASVRLCVCSWKLRAPQNLTKNLT